MTDRDPPSSITSAASSAPCRIIDATGLLCPLPVLRARRALREIAIGEILLLRATDAASLRDIPVFCAATGNELLSVTTEEGVSSFLLRRLA